MKKLLAILLTLLLLVGLTACGEEAKPEGWYSEEGISITQEQVQEIVNSEFTAPKKYHCDHRRRYGSQ